MPHNTVISHEDRQQVFGMLAFVHNSIDDGVTRSYIEAAGQHIVDFGCLPGNYNMRRAACHALGWYCASVRAYIARFPEHVSIEDIQRISLLTQLTHVWGE